MWITFLFYLNDGNLQWYDQDTDGLHKALEASVLRNEVDSQSFKIDRSLHADVSDYVSASY